MGTLPPGTRLGKYEIGDLLGQGGMGAVYRARDERDAVFALKVMRTGAGDASLVRRFQREARAAALVSHPNVCKVVETGEDGGSPWLVLEYAEGGSVKALLRTRGRLAWQQAASLGAQVARALGAIHAAGLTHRDLKPENVLLDAEGRAKVSDFGLVRGDPASALSRGSLTKTGELLGTLEYMAPEQMEDAGKVDARADLYALGATLYCFLTGDPPFRGVGYELVKKHLTETPRPPRDVVPEVPESLEALVLALLAKSPAARPQRADDVAADLEAIAGGRTPHRRGRGKLALAALLGGAVVVGALAVALVLQGEAEPPPAPPAPPPPAPSAPLVRLPKACESFRKTARTRLVSVWGEHTRHSPGIPYAGIAIAPDGKRVLCGSGKWVTLWELPSSELVSAFDLSPREVAWVALSPDGKLAAAGTGQGDLLRIDLATGKWTAIPVSKVPFGSVAFLDARRVVSVSDGKARITNLDDGKSRELASHEGKKDTIVAASPSSGRIFLGSDDGSARVVKESGEEVWHARGHEKAVNAIAVSPDGKTGVTGGADAVSVLWDLVDGKELARLRGHGAMVWGVAVANDRHVVSVSDDWTCRLFSPPDWSGRLFVREPERIRAIPYLRVALTPDGSQAVVASEDGLLRLWDITSGVVERRPRGNGAAINGLAVSIGGTRVVAGDDLGKAIAWDTKDGKETAVLDPRNFHDLHAVALTKDGKRALTCGYGRTPWYLEDVVPPQEPVVLWDLSNGGREAARLGFPNAYSDTVAFSPDERSAILAVRASNTACRIERWELDPPKIAWASKKTMSLARALAFSPDGERVVVDSVDGSASSVELATGEVETSPPPVPGYTFVAAAPRNSAFITSSNDETLLALASGTVPLVGHKGMVRKGAFSPDETLAVTGGDDGTIRLWSAKDGSLLDTIDLSPILDAATALAFDPSGRTFFAGTARGVVLRFELTR